MSEKQDPLKGMTFNQMFQDEIVDEGSDDPNNPNPPAGDPPAGDPPTGDGGEGGQNPKEGNDGDGGDGGEDANLFSQLNQEFGFEFEEEFQEDYDGIKGYVGKASEELAKRQLEELFGQFPAAAEFFDFLMKGGSEEQFFSYKQNTLDLSTLTIAEGDEAMQEKIIRMKLVEDGFDEEEIKAKLESYKSAVLLEAEAKSALKILKKKDETKKAELIKKQELEIKAAQEEYETLINSTQDIVKKGVLQNVQIPEKEKKGFVEFLFSPIDKSGKTRRDEIREKLTLEQKLELEYLIYKGMKLSDLVIAKKQTQDLSHLRKNVDKEGSQQQRRGQSGQQNKTGGIPAGMTINDMF